MQSGDQVGGPHETEISPPRSTRSPHQETSRYPNGQTTVSYDLDGLLVQRNDAHHTLIIDGIWLRLPPLEYHVAVLLLTHFNRPVSVAQICKTVFDSTYSSGEAQRLYRHIYRVRPKLAALSLCIVSLNKRRGYMLLREDTLAEPQGS